MTAEKRAQDLLGGLELRKQLLDQITQIWSNKNSVVYREPRKGFMRGIDFYDHDLMLEVMTRDFRSFQQGFGKIPDLVRPTFFSEKLVYSKYFREFKVPQSGNKLRTLYFIPSELTKELRTADVLWKSKIAELPPTGFLDDGEYYLKSNTGSGRLMLLRFPLDEAQMQRAIERSHEWLKTPYGLGLGEWWYNVFESEIFIEPKIETNGPSISVSTFCVHGIVKAYVLSQKMPTATNWYFNLFWNQVEPRNEPQHPIPKGLLLTDDLKHKIENYCFRIGKHISFARIDFIISSTEELYLLEMTFTPVAGYSDLPMDIQYEIGEIWDPDFPDQIVE